MYLINLESKTSFKTSTSLFYPNKVEFIVGSDTGNLIVVELKSDKFTVRGSLNVCNQESKIVYLSQSDVIICISKLGLVTIVYYPDSTSYTEFMIIRQVIKPHKFKVSFQLYISHIVQFSLVKVERQLLAISLEMF